jgi:hypothetical protein
VTKTERRSFIWNAEQRRFTNAGKTRRKPRKTGIEALTCKCNRQTIQDTH